MKAALNEFLDRGTRLDHAILILQHFLGDAFPLEHQRLIGESCNPSPKPSTMKIGGYGIYGPFPTAEQMVERIKRNVLKAILNHPGLIASLPNGLYSTIKAPSREATHDEISDACDAVADLHGARISASLNLFHNATVLAFPSLRISAREVWLECAVTTPAEFRLAKKGGACAWWSCSGQTDQDNPGWRRTKESLPAFLHRAAAHFLNATPR